MDISIIIPVYNSGRYIEACIKSLLNQTFNGNIEFIFINDGSSDDSIEILNKYKKLDKRIVILTQDNSGVSVARNNGIKASRGKYIGFVDADDYIENTMFEKLYNKIENTNSDMVICNYFKCNIADGKKIKNNLINSIDPQSDNITELIIQHFCEQQDNGYVWNKLYYSKIIKDNNLKFRVGVTIYEDLLFNLEFINHVKKIGYINEGLYNYLIREDSAINKVHSEGFGIVKEIYYISLRLIDKFKFDSNEIVKRLDYTNAMYPYLYSKQQLLINKTNDDRFKEIKAIIRDNYTKHIAKSIKINGLKLPLRARIFYRLINQPFMLYMYMCIINKISIIKNNCS